jgi:DNA repair protein RadC
MSFQINEPSKFKSRITDWPVDERPREKLAKFGPASISSAELIAILLGQGTPKMNAVELAKLLLRDFKTLEVLSNASLTELTAVPGVGPAKAVTLLAAFQLYRNLQKEQASREIVSFTNPAQVARIYQPVIGHRQRETFYVVLLNASMKCIGDFEVSLGTVNASLVHPREVFYPAIRNLATGIIVLHNHPSGELSPSNADMEVTERLIKSGEILDIRVWDHIIITVNNYYSFRQNNLIK